MNLIFTVGLLGGYAANMKCLDYFETKIVSHLTRRRPDLRLIIAVAGLSDLRFCQLIYSLKAKFPGLLLEMAVTDERWRKRDDAVQLYDELAAIFDAVSVLPEQPDSDAYGYFIRRCDFILFNEHLTGPAAANRFRLAASHIPVPVQYRMCYPEYFEENSPYPAERESYYDTRSRHFNPFIELRQSIDYVRSRGFSVGTRLLPQVFLRRWLQAPPADTARYIMGSRDFRELLSQPDTAARNYLPAKLFVYVCSVRDDLWALDKERPSDEEFLRRFRQFRFLLELEAKCREERISMRSVELFSHDDYESEIRDVMAY